MSKKSKLSAPYFYLLLIIPIIAAGYLFRIYDLKTQQKQTLVFSATITQSASSLIHTIQIERGLSAGYLASKKTDNKEKLIKQQKITDRFYNDFASLITNTQKQKNFDKLIQDKKIIFEITQEMDKIKTIRNKVLSHQINFKDEINYYSDINEKLLKVIHNFAIFNAKSNYEGILIYDIESLKENLGLERAYIYNQLLSTNKQNAKLDKIKKLITTQEVIRKNFFQDATPQIKEFYTNFIDEESLKEIQHFRDDFLSHKLSSSDAKKWFSLSTNFIDRHEALSINILDLYLKNIIFFK